MESSTEKDSLNTTAKLLNARKNSKYCPHCKSVVANSTYYRHSKRYRSTSGQWTFQDTEQQVEKQKQCVQNPDQSMLNPDHYVPNPDQSMPNPDRHVPNPDYRVPIPNQHLQNPDPHVHVQNLHQSTPKRRKMDFEVSGIIIQKIALGHGRLIFRMADLWRAILVESIGR